MPQLDQLPLVALSQFFWLLLVLGLIYFGIGRSMLPKIESRKNAAMTTAAVPSSARDRCGRGGGAVRRGGVGSSKSPLT